MYQYNPDCPCDQCQGREPVERDAYEDDFEYYEEPEPTASDWAAHPQCRGACRYCIAPTCEGCGHGPMQMKGEANMETIEKTARPVACASGLMIAPKNGVNAFPVYGPVTEGRDEEGQTIYYCNGASWPEEIVREVLTAKEEAV